MVAHEKNIPDVDGWFQQQHEEGQLYSALTRSGKTPSASIWKLARLQGAPYFYDDLAAALAKPKSAIRLPTTPGAPDFAWADEENMTVAAKHGDELFFTNMVWRWSGAINKSAMVFLVSPSKAVRAEIQLDDIRFVDSGKYETNDGKVDSFSNKNPPDNKLYPNAESLVKYPIAVRPDLKEVPERNMDGGRGTGYTLRFGPWLVGMNGRYTMGPYTMKLPPSFKSGRDLISGKVLRAPVVLPAGTTAVFYEGQPK
jgi:hypothetical protein